MGTCHCSRCRKLGTGTFVIVEAKNFVWLAGKEHMTVFPPTPPFRYTRCFCARCGTSLGEPGMGESFPVNAQCFDDALGVRNRFHEFVADKPDWYEICDGAKQFPGHP
jgi:hypothetical protein